MVEAGVLAVEAPAGGSPRKFFAINEGEGDARTDEVEGPLFGLHLPVVFRFVSVGEGARARQSLTTPRWGGLLLARPAPPQYLLPSRPVAWPARTRRQAQQLQLSFNDL